MTQERLYPPCVSLCSDTLVIRSQSNEKRTIKVFQSKKRKTITTYVRNITKVIFLVLHVLEVAYNKPIVESQSYTHLQGITRAALNYIGGITDRQVALIDMNKDLFLVSIRIPGFGRVCKIGMRSV